MSTFFAIQAHARFRAAQTHVFPVLLRHENQRLDGKRGVGGEMQAQKRVFVVVPDVLVEGIIIGLVTSLLFRLQMAWTVFKWLPLSSMGMHEARILLDDVLEGVGLAKSRWHRP